MRKFLLFFVCIGLTSFAFSQVPIPPSYKPPPPHKPPPRLLPPPPKPKLESFVYNSSGELEWRGTVEEAERAFTISLEDEVDVVRDRESKKSITGYLTILDTNGKPGGKVELKDGKLHGEEIFYDEDGNIVEENYWIEGKLSKTPPPRVKETKIQNTEDDSAKKPRPKFDPFAERPKAEIKDISNPNSSIKPKTIHNLVSDKNSSKSSVVPPFPRPRKPIPPRKKDLDWPDFTYNSPEEKAFWDKLPDWSYNKLPDGIYKALAASPSIYPGKPIIYKRNAQGETIESNSSEGYDGYVKKKVSGYRTVYQFVNGYAIRSKTWSKDGQKKEEKTYKDGIWDGLWTEWWGNGQKKSERNYKDEKLMSVERWKPNGEKCPETNFKDGNGVVVEYNENGQKRSEDNFKDGELDGLMTHWHENGQKKLERNYKDGKAEGFWSEWYENGQKKMERNYKDGKAEGLWSEWHENGQKKLERNYKGGIRIMPPLNPRPPPKRPSSPEANSSKPTPPSLPPWLKVNSSKTKQP